MIFRNELRGSTAQMRLDGDTIHRKIGELWTELRRKGYTIEAIASEIMLSNANHMSSANVNLGRKRRMEKEKENEVS